MEAVSKEVIECNKQFYQTINSNKRIIVHQGGSRSGKTYAICQYIIYLLTTTVDVLFKISIILLGFIYTFWKD